MRPSRALAVALVFLAGGCTSAVPFEGEPEIDCDLEEPPAIDFPAACPEGVIEGDYVIVDGVDAESIEGCHTITGDLWIGTARIHESKVRQVDPLRYLEHVGGDLEVVNNGSLRSLRGLMRLREVGGELAIEANAALETLGGFCSLEQVGDLSIAGNDSLRSIEGFNRLSEAEGIGIYANAELRTISGFERLEHVDRWGIDIGDNEALEAITAFQRVESVRYLGITSNEALTSIEGLSAVRRVDWDVTIWVTGLEDLSGLAGLVSVGSELDIEGNRSLTSLRGLEGLWTLGRDLVVVENPLLPTCEAFALRDQLSERDWGGGWDIRDNLEDDCSR